MGFINFGYCWRLALIILQTVTTSSNERKTEVNIQFV